MDLFGYKSIWKERRSDTFAYYCPNCRSERKLPYCPEPWRAKNIFRVGLTSVFFMLVTWPWFGFKGIVSFLPIWMAFEVYFRTRVRAELSCKSCGFDPYLYLTDVKRARDEIETYWRKKFAEKGIPYPEKNGSGAAMPGARQEAAADAEKVNPVLTDRRPQS
ncbi:MAG: hypothetical protein A2583_06840 [Bdellovibrionales bacterium RIFOXYD1_FULL_53_11]|nr:MAG: hypothetical protein A2583_06840 [Bdellovibrionales bacterium RIFOXYD1_FULL_53_11]